MQYLGKMTATIVTAAIITALGAGAAHAAQTPPSDAAERGGSVAVNEKSARNGTENVGGGVWTYGVSNGSVFSLFDTSRFVHTASVKSSGKVVSSGKVAKGKIAYAKRPSAWFGNKAFWNIY